MSYQWNPGNEEEVNQNKEPGNRGAIKIIVSTKPFSMKTNIK